MFLVSRRWVLRRLFDLRLFCVELEDLVIYTYERCPGTIITRSCMAAAQASDDGLADAIASIGKVFGFAVAFGM